MELTFTAKVNLVKNPTSSLKGFGTLIVNDVLELSGFRIIEGAKGLFAASPSTKGAKPDENGKDVYFDNIRFLDKNEDGFSDVKAAAQQALLEAFGAALGDGRGDTAKARTDDPKPSGKRPGMARTASW